MSQKSPCAEFRARLRAYALRTLSEADQTATRRHLDTCPDCATALDEEIRALSSLDRFPDSEPSRDLAGAVMEQVRLQPVARRERSRVGTLLAFGTAGCLILIVAGLLMPALSRSRESARRASSAGNLKQIALVLKMYANEQRGGLFPAISRYDGLWMFDLEALAPEYLSDMNVLINPQLAEDTIGGRTLDELRAQDTVDWEAMTRLASRNYTFIGWAVQDAEDLAAVVTAMAGDEDTRRGDRQVAHGGKTISPLREGVERFMITDINNPGASSLAKSQIPTLFERMDPENPEESYNVLYLDGHVEQIPYDTRFPITERVARMLANSP